MSVTNVIRNPGTYIANKWRLYRRLLFAPSVFYEEEAGERGLRFEILLILFIGVVGTAISYLMVQELFSVVSFSVNPGPNEFTLAEGALRQIRLQSYSIPLVGAFAIWVSFTLSLYATSWFYSDVGSIFHILKNTAWALLPVLFFYIFRFGGMVATVMMMSEEELTEQMRTASNLTNPDNIAPQVLSYATDSTITMAATAVGFVFVLWAGYIAAHGIKDVRGIELDQAYRATAFPVAGFILYVVLGMI